MKKILILLNLVFITNILFAQLFENKYTSKSVIITQTDTIDCYLIFDENFGDKIEYKLSKEDKNREKKNVLIKEVIQIKKSGDIYDKLVYKNREYLMKRLTKGQVKLYEHTSNVKGLMDSPPGVETTNPFNTTRYDTPYEKINYYIEKDNTLYKIRKSNKKKDLKKILVGNSEIIEMIENLDNSLLGYNLKKIVSKYNYWLRKGNK